MDVDSPKPSTDTPMLTDDAEIAPQNPNLSSSQTDLEELQEQVISNLHKPNVPNVNVPERIIICLDVCYDDRTSLYRLGDGTTFTPINMLKRILDFFIHTKHTINKRTEFALMIMKDTEAIWVQNFTSNVKDIINSIDHTAPEESTSENFEFAKVFNILKSRIEVPEFSEQCTLLPPAYVVRLVIIYARSNCIPVIPRQEEYFLFLRKQMYFYIDILFAHDDCTAYKCEDVFDALQELDNGYSYIFEVSRNATKIHDSSAKLLAHPLQRPLQKNTDYKFGSKCGQ